MYLGLSCEVNDLVEEQRAHVTLGRVYLNLAVKYAEDEAADEVKNKALAKAEKQFPTARALCSHTK